jgi:hypothetical protein
LHRVVARNASRVCTHYAVRALCVAVQQLTRSDAECNLHSAARAIRAIQAARLFAVRCRVRNVNVIITVTPLVDLHVECVYLPRRCREMRLKPELPGHVVCLAGAYAAFFDVSDRELRS